ncbi:MAG: ABC transporter ATP-binding protein [Rhodocyclaceae bacterium]|nr:ABC transporter ATP-binding protein [Rhodocyclaceae bacterium]
MSDSPPLVKLTDVNFAYDQRPILMGINMEIHRGQVVAIMGISGGGKTTTLRLIGGQLKPSSGEVRVNGVSVPDLDTEGLYDMRRRMGMLFQFGALFTDMTVFDNVAFQMREHTDLSETTIHDLVMLKLNAVGLANVHACKPSELSGGMARRVALARAIALDPMLIMYDEPFAGLDPISLSTVGTLIRQLNDALGASSIIVTHDVSESLKIVDYIYFVSEGRIIAEGTADDIRASDAPFVHQFVRGDIDGPMAFHYPSPPWRDDLYSGAVGHA